LLGVRCRADEPAPKREVKPRRVLNNKYFAAVRSVKFSPDGKQIAAGGDSTSLNVWDAQSGKQITNFGDSDDKRFEYGCVDFSPDGKVLATGAAGSDGGCVQLWLIEKQTVLAALERKEARAELAFSPDGKTLACATKGGVTVLDVATRKERMTLKGQEGGASCVAFSSDGGVVASGGDGVVCVWETAPTAKPPFLVLKGHAERVESVAISPDNKLLASADRDRAIKLWELPTGKELRAFRGWHCAFTADSKHLLVYSERLYGVITIWDVATGAKRAEIKTDFSSAHTLTMSPDRKSLAVGGDHGEVLVWDVKSLLGVEK
jgi:WD40 repeat protein